MRVAWFTILVVLALFLLASYVGDYLRRRDS